MSARVKRVKEAEEHPERFRVLCQRHHTQLEGTRKHNPNFSFDQLIKTVGVIIPTQEAPF